MIYVRNLSLNQNKAPREHKNQQFLTYLTFSIPKNSKVAFQNFKKHLFGVLSIFVGNEDANYPHTPINTQIQLLQYLP